MPRVAGQAVVNGRPPGLFTEELYQGANNFVIGAVGTAAGADVNNKVKAQGFLLGSAINV